MAIPKWELKIYGESKTKVAAREALPRLISYAEARQTITYKELTDEVGLRSARSAKDLLGHIGYDLQTVSRKVEKFVPPLMAMAVGARTRLPYGGLYKYFEKDVGRYIGDMREFSEQPTSVQRDRLQKLYDELENFEFWDLVLTELGLDRVPPVSKQTLDATGNLPQGGKESQEHLALKDYVYDNPGEFGIKGKIVCKKREFVFPSSDAADVMFKTKDEWVAVEVKADGVGDTEVLRGIFQSIKYCALTEALQIADGCRGNASSLLVLGGKLPSDLLRTTRLLGVTVRDGIQLK